MAKVGRPRKTAKRKRASRQDTRLSPEEFKAMKKSVPDRMTVAEWSRILLAEIGPIVSPLFSVRTKNQDSIDALRLLVAEHLKNRGDLNLCPDKNSEHRAACIHCETTGDLNLCPDKNSPGNSSTRDMYSSSLSSPPTEQEGEDLTPARVSGFVGAAGQGVLLVDDQADAELVEVAELWAEVVPFCQVKDPVSFIRKLTRAYPMVNLREWTFKVEAWWDANPDKRKTKRGLKRFLNAWASRDHEAATKAPPQRNDKPDPHESTVAAVWGSSGGYRSE